MKILVDSTLSQKEDWFSLIPLIINIDGKEIIDKNEEVNRNKILNAKDARSSFLNFNALKEKEILNIDNEEKIIIFTIPSKLSGQYNSYKTFNKNKNILIVEGHCFLIFKNQIKSLLKRSSDLAKIEKEINNLNQKTQYYGLIIDPKHISSKGRISSVLLKTFDKLNLKIILKFTNGRWKRKGFLRNVSKTVGKIINNKNSVTIIAINEKEYNKYKEIFSKYIPKEKINFQQMSNAMILHSGKGFISLYTK